MKALYKRSADVSSGLNKSSLQDMKNLKSLQSCLKIVPEIYSSWKSKLLSPVCDCLILAFCELGPFERKHKWLPSEHSSHLKEMQSLTQKRSGASDSKYYILWTCVRQGERWFCHECQDQLKGYIMIKNERWRKSYELNQMQSSSPLFQVIAKRFGEFLRRFLN